MRRLLVLVAACGGSSAPPPTASLPGATTTTSGDAPEISRSVGVDGGIVVLWPRVRGDHASSRELARQIQERLVEIARRTHLPVDVRPEPERVCPRSGCKAVALGAALLRKGDACAVIATASPPGQAEATIVPWAGELVLKSPVAAFREPPEPQVQVQDYAHCDAVIGELAARDKDVEAALQVATGG